MKASEEKLKNILKSIPSREEIREFLNYGDVNQTNAYELCTNVMRIKIIDGFIELNSVLEKIVEDMKMQVLYIFTDEDKGRLKFIYPLNCNSEIWIDNFIKRIEGEKRYPLLIDALKKFQNYTINVQGFLIHEIREQLDPIDISLPKKDGSSNAPHIKGDLAHPDAVVEDIEELLKTYAEEVYNNVKAALNNLYQIPNRSMFAAIKDLYDRVTYNAADNQNKISKEWRYLYEDWMHLIWKEDYQRESEMQIIVEQWNEIIESLKEFNSLNYFTI